MTPTCAGPRDVRASAGRQVEVLHLDDAQRAAPASAPCGTSSRRPPPASRTGSTRAGSPRRCGWPRTRRRPAPRRRGPCRDRASRGRPRGGTRRSARDAGGRRPPTGCAGRCAAACGRSGGPSRSRPWTRAPGGDRRARRRGRSVPSSRSTTSVTSDVAERSRVVRLSAGRRVERRAIEHHDGTAVGGRRRDHGGVELDAGRIGVVEAFGHGSHDFPGDTPFPATRPGCRCPLSSSGSRTPASANPLARSTQLSQRPHGAPPGPGS